MQATENTVVNFEAQNLGERIAVVSTKGGAGTTSILANIAWGLAAQKGISVACADLDFATGDMDLQFSVKANQALLEMLQYPERLEPIVYQRSGINALENLHVFTGYSGQLEQTFWPDINAVNKISQFCQQQASFLLWDIPAFSLRDATGFATLAGSDIQIIVVEPTLASIRSTNQLLAKLDNQQTALTSHKTSTLLVLNHTKPESASLISKADVIKALARNVDVELPYAPQPMLANTTLGKFAVSQKNRSGRALQQLVQLIHSEPKSVRSGLFNWRKGA